MNHTWHFVAMAPEQNGRAIGLVAAVCGMCGVVRHVGIDSRTERQINLQGACDARAVRD